MGSSFNESHFSDSSSDIGKDVKDIGHVNVRRLDTHIVRASHQLGQVEEQSRQSAMHTTNKTELLTESLKIIEESKKSSEMDNLLKATVIGEIISVEE